LNAKGASGESVAPGLADKPRIASFLSYVDGGDTMGDEWVEDLDKQVRALNADVGWRQTVLGLQLEFEHARHLAQKEGHAMGVAEGREAGLAEGREAGLAEGREAGLAEGRKEADRIDAELVDALSAAGRLDELADALRSPEKKTQLLMEFDIS
jgi:flagellar biosynthesis/type III secretory pathway protein FliH